MSAPSVSAAMVAHGRRIGEPRWSPNGSRLGYLSAFDGRVDLFVGSFEHPWLVATSDVAVTPIGAYGGGGYAWAGDEIVVATAGGELVVLGPEGGRVRRVLSYDGTASAPAVSSRGVVAFVCDRSDACDVAVVPLDGSEPPQRVSSADFAWDPAWSPDGRHLAWHEWDLPNMPWDGSRIASATVTGTAVSGVRLLAGGDEVSVGQPRFAPDGGRLAFVTDREGFSNVWTASFDGADAAPVLAEGHEHAEPAWGPGQRSFAWSPDGSEIACCRNEGGFGRLVAVRTDVAGLVRDIATAWHRGIEWGTSGILATRSGARTPDEIVVYGADGRRRSVARGPVGGWPERARIEPEPITWRSADVTVHGLLYRPHGVDRPPLIVSVHGGPTGQAVADWRERVAFFCDRGWAVLRPNHRGSTGYGRAFMRSLDGGWGVSDVEDIADGIRDVARRGLIDGGRVVIEGASAGGMAVFLVCARYPELVRAGVSLFGVADLVRLAESTHRFESRYLDRLVGAPADCPARYEQRSPVNCAADIAVPLLVHQGSDDEVVPRAQSDAMVDAIRRGGGTVEYHVYDGEGHGLRRRSSIVAELERTAAFCESRVGAT